jgi:N-methylhydantoinase A
VLGIIDPARFLGGRMRLDRDLAEAAIAPLAARLGLSVQETAAGINRVVDSKMADLVRRVSLLRGFDPRRFDCFAFGGGGPVHMTAVAAQSGIRRVIVPLPRTAPVWSALGAAASDVTHVLEEWRVLDLPVEPGSVNDVFARLEAQAQEVLAAEGIAGASVALRRSMRMRYAMQVHDVEVPVGPGELDEASLEALDLEFGGIHDELFGKDSGFRQGGVQITGFQVRAVGTTAKPDLAPEDQSAPSAPGHRSVYWYELERSVQTPVLRTTAPTADGRIPGPALVELPESVIVVRPGQVGGWDALGNFVVELDAVPVDGVGAAAAVAEPVASW